MIFITAKFKIRPEDAGRWPQIAAEFTEATRSEPGCLWFDWSRSVDDPEEYVLVEAFRDDPAGAAHVQSDHFKKAQQTLPPHRCWWLGLSAELRGFVRDGCLSCVVWRRLKLMRIVSRPCWRS